MLGKMARSETLDQAFGLPEVLVAVSTSRLSCKRAGKTRTLMPVWDSSGESRVITGTVADFWYGTKNQSQVSVIHGAQGSWRIKD